jgi:multiple antibiotic resistance protein
MTLDQLTNAFVTLVVIIEPVAIVPLFLALTQGFTASQRRQTATRASIIAFFILAGVALVGDWVLSKLGISLPAFRIAGGLLLFWIAFEMVFQLRATRKSSTARAAIEIDHIKNVAAFPLAIPLLAGPGAIAATLLLVGQARGDLVHIALLIAIIALVMVISWACLFMAERLDKLLGTTGNAVLSRLLGIILAALAVQFVVDGIKAIAKLA